MPRKVEEFVDTINLLEKKLKKKFPEDGEKLIELLRNEPQIIEVLSDLIHEKPERNIREVLPSMITVSNARGVTYETAQHIIIDLSSEGLHKFKRWLSEVQNKQNQITSKRKKYPPYF